MAPAKKPDQPADPDHLSRQTAGSYRTTDGRFEARQGGVGWYLVDLERTNELGQELLHGQFATLKEVQAEIPAVRKVVPLAARPTRRTRVSANAEPPPSPPPPKTWIDRLPDDEQPEIRRLIRAVEGEGLADAEDLVKRARGSTEPLIVNALIEAKLNALVDEADDAAQRRQRRELVRRVLAAIADEGELTRSPLPRWELVETSTKRDKPRRLRPSV